MSSLNQVTLRREFELGAETPVLQGAGMTGDKIIASFETFSSPQKLSTAYGILAWLRELGETTPGKGTRPERAKGSTKLELQIKYL